MSNEKPSGMDVSNPQEGSTADAKGTQGPLYFFYPDTAELFICPVESVSAVAQEIALMDKLAGNLMQAREELGEAHANWLAQQSDTALRPQLESKLKAAIKKEEAATADVHEKLEETPAFNKDGVWELMPLRKMKSGNDQYVGKRLTYVRSDKVKNHFRRYKLESDKPQLKSFLVKNAQSGKYELDHKKIDEKLKEALHKATLHEWKTPPWGGDWSLDFTEAFNKRANFKSPDSPDAMAQFSGGVQFFRYFAGAGASLKAENSFKSFDDVLKLRGEIAMSGKAKGEIGGVLADGKLEADFYLPWKAGLELWIPAPTQQANGAVTWNSTPDTTLGFFRLALVCKGEASCGASLLAEGTLEFKLGRDGKTQKIRGSRAKRDLKQMQQPKLDVTKVEVKGDLGGDLKAFVGVEVEGSFEGAFQWRRPEEKEWKAFASVKPGVSGQAGAGAQAALHITYDGKFRVLLKAGVCVGAGMKGEVEAVVDVVYMAEFAWWAKTQVAYAGDRNLKYFEASALQTFAAMYALALVKGQQLGAYVGRQYQQMKDELDDFVRTSPRQFVEAVKNANDSLLNGLAEVKGYLIYSLQQIGDQFDEWRSDATDAIHRILASAQISNELQNIYQFTSPEFCVKGDAQLARTEISGFVGGHQLAMIESRVRDDPAPGYAFAFNDTAAYAMQEGTNVAWLDPKTTGNAGGGNGTMVA